MMRGMDDLAPYVTGWAPEPVETRAVLDPWPAGAFAGLLDAPSPVREPGDPLPPLWQWFYFLDHPAQSEIGDDGHPAHGHFLPAIPDRRRMFAGGRLEVREPLRVGAEVVRRSSLAAVTPKRGRSGAMVFVTVRHEFRAGRGDGRGRGAGHRLPQPAAGRGARRSRARCGRADRAGGVEARLEPDEAMLFRFSALTYNTHRIHYDQPYVTQVEGYPGLVVHGPLLALLLLELPRRHAPGRPVRSFSFRLRRPAFAGAPIVAGRAGRRGRAGGRRAGAAAVDHGCGGHRRLTPLVRGNRCQGSYFRARGVSRSPSPANIGTTVAPSTRRAIAATSAGARLPTRLIRSRRCSRER